jgi:hypothetical protein
MLANQINNNKEQDLSIHIDENNLLNPVSSTEGAKLEEGFSKFNPNEDTEGMEEVNEYQVVDQERCYMLSFIKKNRKVA